MGKDLGFAGQAPKGARMDNAPAVALKRGSIGMLGLVEGALRQLAILRDRAGCGQCGHCRPVIRDMDAV